jgi:hybrid cluster-associated redox disulfide protein
MKRIALPETEMTVDQVMQQWPCTIRAFLDFNMHCVGCPIATFHSVEEACREHGIDLVTFLRRLQAAAKWNARLPFGVNFVVLTPCRLLPVYPEQRTSSDTAQLVRFVPQAVIVAHSTKSSVRASTDGEIVRPSNLARPAILNRVVRPDLTAAPHRGRSEKW